jgi:uncharacterized damage-inducible protein DinB
MTSGLDLLRKLFSYDQWALGQSSASLTETQNPAAQLMLAHILLAEKIWLRRLKGEDSSSIATFQELSLEECAALSDELFQAYKEFLDSLSDQDLESSITYKNTKGIEFQTPVKDVLLHVGLHAVYHRGQIALLVRSGGGAAVNTDYITFTRL